jgi:hypothetical protein
MRWRSVLSRVVAAPLLLSGLASLHSQGEWFTQYAWGIIPAFGFVAALIGGLFAVALRDWRMLRSCALIAAFSICVVIGLGASGRFVFRVKRMVVQRSSEQLVPRIEEYRQKHGTYPNELAEASLEAPTFGSAWSVYVRDDDGSFGFVICDPGIAGQSYVWDSRSRQWRDHYEPGWIF